MLSLAVEWRLSRLIEAFHIHDDLPVPIADIAARMGWQIGYRPRMLPLYGMAECPGGKCSAVINADIGPTSQRATIAHEISHWIAGHLDSGEVLTSEMDAFESQIEQEAWEVAAVLLIPRSELLPDATAASIAATCDVPSWLVRLRLRMQE